MKKTALITGANRGIGFEIARSLGHLGCTTIISARDPARGRRAAEMLCSEGMAARFVIIDVTDKGSIASAAKSIAAQWNALDILINNAGILLDRDVPPSDVGIEHLRGTFETNVFGVVATIQAFLPLLRRSAAGRIVNVSSGVGSLTFTSTTSHPYNKFNDLAYNTSKAALNMVTIQFANQLRETSIKVNSVDPGYCATQMNGYQGTRSPKEGARIAVRLATLDEVGPTGGFYDESGVLPW